MSPSSSSSKRKQTLPTKEDLLVVGLDEIEPAYADFAGSMYAGLLPSNNHNRVGEMMFWLFEPSTQTVPDTMVIWLNGGPGCSSFNCGVFMEHSPVTQPLHDAGYCCLANKEPSLHYNEFTWTRHTTMLYPEQPIGTGFSHGSPLPETELEVGMDLYAFMQNFYSVFDHLAKYKLFIMGESYAGMYLPSVGRYFHLQNQQLLKNPDLPYVPIPIGGVSIGNGWMNAYIQGPAVIDYAWWHGEIDEATRNALFHAWDRCVNGDTSYGPPFHPFNVQDDCGIMWGVLQAGGNFNAYDTTTWDPNVDQITFASEAFYNSQKVQSILHAPHNITWHGCIGGAGRRRLQQQQQRRLYMDNDRPIDVVPYVADLLEAGIPVLVYNGDRDMTTNSVGSERLLNSMTWFGQEEWPNAPRGLWKTDNYPSGWAKEYQGLTFVVVYNSGHMVPYNQPIPALDLLQRFLQQQTFIDEKLPQIRVDPMTTGNNLLFPTTNNNTSMTIHHLLVVLVSFVAGMAVMWLWSQRKQRRDYQAVPNCSNDLPN